MRSKRTMKNIFFTLILQIIVLVYGFVVPKLIIKSFGSDVNGLISSISQFLSYIALLESGVGPVVKAALYRPIANNDKQGIKNILKASEKFFRVISLIFVVYLIGLCIFYPLLIKSQFGYIFTLSLIIIISISTFFEYYFGITYRLFLHAKQKTYVISIIQIVTYMLNMLSVIVLIKFNANIQVIKLVSGFLFVLRPIVQNIYVKKKYNIDLKEADKNYKLEKKWDGLAQHIAAIVHDSTDVSVLTLFSELSEVSVYSVYGMVIKGVKSIVTSFSSGIEALFGDMMAKKEKEKLNKSFSLYEIMYFFIITIVYSCTLVLVVPFVEVYTFSIVDVNYVRPVFGYLMVLCGFFWAIRLPYSSITLAAGHFKETRKGAWIEAIINIVLSVVLVIKFGLIGVAIGTLVAMLVRTLEFIYHSNKYILERNIFDSIKKILLIVIETLLVVIIYKAIPKVEGISYLTWIINAFIIFVITTAVVLGINIVFYKKEFKEIYNIIIKIRKKVSKCKES